MEPLTLTPAEWLVPRSSLELLADAAPRGGQRRDRSKAKAQRVARRRNRRAR